MKFLTDAISERYSDLNDLSSFSKLYLVDKNKPNFNIVSESDIAILIPANTSPRIQDNTVVVNASTMVINDQNVSHIGNEKELETMCINLLELDIAKNEITHLNEIKKLLNALKKLRFLNLSHNKLMTHTIDYFETDWTSNETFNNLKMLILNSCQLCLKSVEAIISRLPELYELHLSGNNYSEITFGDQFSKDSIKVFHFNNNELVKWNEVNKLGKCFPCLETLSLCENKLNDIDCLDKDSFSKLNMINLTKLNIKNWSSFDFLRKLPNLKNIRIQNIPLLNGYNNDEKYFLTVASLNENLLETLNGSKVDIEDKDKCERKYIRFFMDSNETIKPDRYYELELKHGKLDKLAEVKMERKREVSVKIKYNEKHMYTKLDLNKTVGQFKKSLEEFVGEQSVKFRIYYYDMEACSAYGCDELKIMTKKLYTINIKDGDEFVIDLKSD